MGAFDKLNFFFKQKVNEGDLDLLQANILDSLFQQNEDLIGEGLLYGGDVTPNDPEDMTVLASTLLGYGVNGTRIETSSQENVDCSEDVNGNTTAVENSGNEKWISVYVDFDWNKTDARTDGNGDVIYYDWQTSFKFEVVQGSEASAGGATKPAVRHDGSILLADILLDYGQTQIFAGDIDESRKQETFSLDNLNTEINDAKGTRNTLDNRLSEILAGDGYLKSDDAKDYIIRVVDGSLALEEVE